MKAGAVEFLTKPFGDDDLLTAIQEAISADRAARRDTRIERAPGPVSGLTPREREVMGRVVSGLLNKQVAAQLGTQRNHRQSASRPGDEKMQARSLRTWSGCRAVGPLYEGIVDQRAEPSQFSCVTSIPLVSIVDDDESVRESLRGLIRSIGLGVQTSRRRGTSRVQSKWTRPTALILDVRMPGMSGLDLHISFVTGRRDIPIIFITAHGSDEGIARARAARRRGRLPDQAVQ